MEQYSDQPPPPPRRSHGCLWGCLGTAAAIAIIVAAVFSFGAWYFYKGFERDPNIQAIMQAVKSHPRAEAVLGKNIKLLEVEVHTFDYSTGRGGTATYVLRLAGSVGEGELKAHLDTSDGGARIKLMILTGKDGQQHYLAGAPPPHPMMDRSI